MHDVVQQKRLSAILLGVAPVKRNVLESMNAFTQMQNLALQAVILLSSGLSYRTGRGGDEAVS